MGHPISLLPPLLAFLSFPACIELLFIPLASWLFYQYTYRIPLLALLREAHAALSERVTDRASAAQVVTEAVLSAFSTYGWASIMSRQLVSATHCLSYAYSARSP